MSYLVPISVIITYPGKNGGQFSAMNEREEFSQKNLDFIEFEKSFCIFDFYSMLPNIKHALNSSLFSSLRMVDVFQISPALNWKFPRKSFRSSNLFLDQECICNWTGSCKLDYAMGAIYWQVIHLTNAVDKKKNLDYRRSHNHLASDYDDDCFPLQIGVLTILDEVDGIACLISWLTFHLSICQLSSTYIFVRPYQRPPEPEPPPFLTF